MLLNKLLGAREGRAPRTTPEIAVERFERARIQEAAPAPLDRWLAEFAEFTTPSPEQRPGIGR